MKYYVSMIDTFMSRWGGAEGKTNYYVVECDNLADAELILKNAKKRSEMRYARIVNAAPDPNREFNVVTRRHFADLGGIWKE